jgi:hypothetical protein
MGQPGPAFIAFNKIELANTNPSTDQGKRKGPAIDNYFAPSADPSTGK